MKLNFGCGKQIKYDFINVDIQKHKLIDKSFDFNKFPYPFKSNSFDYIFTRSTLQYLDDVRKVINELWRISKSNAIIEIDVPFYNSRCAYNDVEYKTFFNETTFENLIEPRDYLHFAEKRFDIIELKLKPTKLGKLIYPKKLRTMLSYIIGEVYSNIEVKLEVRKTQVKWKHQ